MPPKKPAAAATPNFDIAVNGKRYNVDPTDFTGLEARAFREAVGLTIMEVSARPDLDAIAGMVWIVMRRDDSDLTFEEVAGAITWRSLSEEAVAGAGPVPEA